MRKLLVSVSIISLLFFSGAMQNNPVEAESDQTVAPPQVENNTPSETPSATPAATETPKSQSTNTQPQIESNKPSETPATTETPESQSTNTPPQIENNKPSETPAATETPESQSTKEQEEKTGQGDEEIRVSLDFKEADIADVLSALSKAYGLNIIAGKEIAGKVSINLTDVTLDDALKSLLGLNKYSYTRERNIITIVAESTQAKAEVFRLEFTKPGDVTDLFKDVLSEHGDLKTNDQLNEIIITDIPDALAKARELLFIVDSPPPQVIIEAKLVDIDPNEFSNLGADLDLNYLTNLSEGAHNLNIDYNLAGPRTSLGGPVVTSVTTPSFTPANTFTIDSLLQKTKANLLSAPRIAVLNNQSAKIVIGEKVGIREQTQTASGTIESIRFVDVGITLKVTPQINRGGYVTMEISTEVSSVKEFVDNLPRITTREATTEVRVKNDQTIVIAGLLKDDYTETASSFPLFTHIPIIGQLLSNFGSSRNAKELVVFITPHIMYAGDRIDPENLDAVAKETEELEGVKVRHEQLMQYFKKDGIEDAVDLALEHPMGELKNYYARAQWFDSAAQRKYDSRRMRDTQRNYYLQAAGAYETFAKKFPDDPRAYNGMMRAAEIYEKIINQPEMAYEAYRFIVTQQAKSPNGISALDHLKTIKKQMDKDDRSQKKRQEKLMRELTKFEIHTEPVTEVPHGEVPVSSA